MFRNYLIVTLRNFSKNFGYTFINIVGLAIGITCCLLVSLYVKYELSYESFHEKKDSIFRYVPRGERDGLTRMQTMVPAGFGPLIKESFHEIKYYTRFTSMDERPLLTFNNTVLDAKVLALADRDFFTMFSFNLVQGDVRTVLQRPLSIAIAKSVADKFFPQGDALGKIVRYDNEYDLEVSGVFQDVPSNSHLQFTYVMPFETAGKIVEDRYGYKAQDFLSNLNAWNYPTYFFIPNVNDLENLAERIDKKFTEARGEEFKAQAIYDWLQPITEIHFTQGIVGDTANGNLSHIYIFTAVALLILVIACFNFMNLSTARAIKRAKEVGLRKVMGAFRHQLIKQFLGETLALVSTAMLLSIVLLELTVPLFNFLMGLDLRVQYLGKGSFLWIFLLVGILTGILAGSYPAFYLSSFAPVKVLKGQIGEGGNVKLRKVLTITQFAGATFLLIAVMVVYAQMAFIRNKKMGFDQDNIIYLSPPAPVWNKKEVLKENLLAHTAVKSISFSNGTPGMESSTFKYEFPGTNIPSRIMNTMAVDFDYISTFNLEIIKGRNLSLDFATDTIEAYLINETAVKELLLENPIGTPIRALNKQLAGKIVGVVKDFHYRSLHRKIEPLVLRYDAENMWCMSIKMKEGNITENLALVEKEWKKVAPDYPFNYEFLDKTVEKQYKAEQNTSVLLTSFTVLAILIACLGLLGLTAFMIEQRKKEIGIRKVLGASIPNIVVLLSTDLSKLVLTGFIIVVPVAWYAVNQWLQDFEYKVEVSPLIYLVAGLIMALITWTSIAYHSIKAAIMNPSETLRSE